MKVLDIDLDFFLASCCPLAPIGERPELLSHEPWDKNSFCRFLEDNCGLSREKKTMGRVFLTHDAALLFWQELMHDKKLCAPFDVVHVDAHSDLGIGKPGPGFVLNSVLSYDIGIRCDTDKYYAMNKLDEANYLLFALAFRYVRTLVNVRNKRSLPDIPNEIVHRDIFGKYDSISLNSPILALLHKPPEPTVLFTVYDDWTQFSDSGFDFVSLAISPRYSPKEADILVDYFREYIVEI